MASLTFITSEFLSKRFDSVACSCPRLRSDALRWLPPLVLILALGGALLPVPASAADTDGDGLPDDWENAHGLNPNNPLDACLDSDGDGLVNWQEHRAGTDPADASSQPPVLAIATPFSGAIVITFDAPPSYRLLAAPIPEGPWTFVPNAFGSPHFEPISGESKYYRLADFDGPEPRYSANIVGYRNQACAPGSNTVVNWLRSGGNTIAVLIPSVPDGSYVEKAGSPRNVFDGAFFEWSDPDMVLPPGELFVFFNPEPGPVTLTFVGEATLPPTLIGSPASQTVPAATNVTFRVEAEGAPAPGYQWQFNGTNIPGATCAVLSLTNVQPAQAGCYSVIVANLAGQFTQCATLEVRSPSLLISGLHFSGGGSVQISFNTIPSVRYEVQASSDLRSWLVLGTILGIGGTATFSDFAAGPHPLRYYRVARLDGLEPLYSANIVGYRNQTCAPGSNTVVNWLSSGNNTIASLIPYAPDGAYVVKTGSPPNVFDGAFFAWSDPNMVLSPGEPFTFFNPEPGAFTLTLVGEATLPPEIVTVPASQFVAPGANVNFQVDAYGLPASSYQWQFNGVNLPGQTCPMLSLPNVQPAQAGTYSVIVSNAVGQATGSATLTVQLAAILAARRYAAGQFEGTVDGVMGHRYAVQASPNLSAWVSLTTNSAPFSFTNTSAPLTPRQFYRAVLVE